MNTRGFAIAVLLLAACASPPSTTPGAVASPATAGTDAAGNPIEAGDVRPIGALTELDDCPPPPSATDADVPTALVLPAATIVTAVQEIDPVVSVEGYVPLTPSQFRRFYENVAGYELLQREDEGFDAEVLVTDGGTRVFLEVLAVCAQGSRFVAVLGEDTTSD